MGIFRPTKHDWDEHQNRTHKALNAEQARQDARDAADKARKTARAERVSVRQERLRAKVMRDTRGAPRLKEPKVKRGKTVVVAGGKKKRRR